MSAIPCFGGPLDGETLPDSFDTTTVRLLVDRDDEARHTYTRFDGPSGWYYMGILDRHGCRRLGAGAAPQGETE